MSDGGHECPECGRDDFQTDQAMRSHYGQMHEGSIARTDARAEGDIECPFDGCGYKSNYQGVKIHYGSSHEGTIAGERFVCDNCDEERIRPRAQINQNGNNFCDWDCKSEFGRATGTCANCGEDLDRQKHTLEDTEHPCCDVECWEEWMAEYAAENHTGEKNPNYSRVSVECDWCESEKLVPESRAASRDHHFCRGTDCEDRWRGERWEGESNPNYGKDLSGPNNARWDGGAFPYGAGWNDAKKELVRERDGRQCRICGKSESAHIEDHGRKHSVHHIVRARELQDAPAEIRNGSFNLVTICRSHNTPGLEAIPSWIQFMAFLPHPPQPDGQTDLGTFADD